MQRAWHGLYGSDCALATLKQAHIAHKVTCVRQCCNYQNPKVVGYVVAVSFVELSTLVYPISKSGPTQTSVLVVNRVPPGIHLPFVFVFFSSFPSGGLCVGCVV